MKDIIKLSAAELAEKLAAGELTSVEATQAYIDHIIATDGEPRDAENRAAGKSGLNAFLLPP